MTSPHSGDASFSVYIRGCEVDVIIHSVPSARPSESPWWQYKLSASTGEELEDVHPTFHTAYTAALKAAEGMIPLRRYET